MTTKIQQQQSFADEMLAKIRILDPHAVVAGGAPRDWSLDRPAKDIDVFMRLPRLVQGQSALNGTLRILIPGEWQTLSLRESFYDMNSDVRDVYQLNVPDQPTLQVVRLESGAPYRVPETFPLSISRVVYAAGRVQRWSDFDTSVKHKVIWKTQSYYPDAHPYISRIREKFPEYSYFSSKTEFLESLA